MNDVDWTQISDLEIQVPLSPTNSSFKNLPISSIQSPTGKKIIETHSMQHYKNDQEVKEESKSTVVEENHLTKDQEIEIDIVGEKEQREIKTCPNCHFPILTFGRYLPCCHFFCIQCAESNNSSCYLYFIF